MTMLIHFAGPQIVELVAQILADQESFPSESRRGHREPLVLPAHVDSPMAEFGVEAFTRNLSSQGLCLIAPQPFRPTSESNIRVVSEATPHAIGATCQWSKKFGLAYWISGWSLESKLPLGKLMKEDGRAEPEFGADVQMRTAVPVSVQQDADGELPNRISAFTRNLSDKRVSLVSKSPFQTGRPGVLDIRRLNGETNSAAAHCTWCQPYRNSHWISTWEFVSAGS